MKRVDILKEVLGLKAVQRNPWMKRAMKDMIESEELIIQHFGHVEFTITKNGVVRLAKMNSDELSD